MPKHNADIAAIFEEIANLHEIQGTNPYRIRAYRNAARTIGRLSQDVYLLVEKNADLTRLPDIGDNLSSKIKEIVSTNRCSLLQRLHKELPPAIAELLKIPGIGPKRVKTLYNDLDAQTIEQLCRAARIRTLPGFGEKTELNILQSFETHVNQARRLKLAITAQYAEALKVFLSTIPGVTKITIAESYRLASPLPV
jgi:DNA polymerase (family 10)